MNFEYSVCICYIHYTNKTSHLQSHLNDRSSKYLFRREKNRGKLGWVIMNVCLKTSTSNLTCRFLAGLQSNFSFLQFVWQSVHRDFVNINCH